MMLAYSKHFSIHLQAATRSSGMTHWTTLRASRATAASRWGLGCAAAV